MRWAPRASRRRRLHHQDDLAELAAGREALVGRADLRERERRGDRHGDAAGGQQGSTLRSMRRAVSAFSSSVRERSIEPQIRARLPISTRRSSCACAPALRPITTIRPSGASASRLSARFGAPTSSRITSNGPYSRKSSGALTVAPSAPTASCSAALRTVACTRAPAATASPIAAVPTPPAPPCTSSRSPASRPHWLNSASWAVGEDLRHAARGRPVEVRRHGHQCALIDHRELRLPAAADDPHHAVAELEALGDRAAFGDLACELEPGYVQRCARRRRIVTAALHDVGAVEPGRADPDEHLTGARLGGWVLARHDLAVFDRAASIIC